ncbi:(2Fe-2S) ferredoxin domain-containing protein [Marinilongibacter aquaticus]|uniref:(2Fe-2S) ferredoxin domain-containing protein n=1 Tax=Marinilongibacter aquaticus TaxID=2975157 RepID=UPI0021BD5C74|nr:(2Fe-2S) ferredoxin domain-containing protein [Marinilongibacter aquaticus]UBM58118.1 (2Fe-2S) ferredoxin domain-containing protein [Marinilongibacter aquaticus]
MKYKKHVFVCTNDKVAPKKCCGSERGMEIVNAFKESLTEKGLQREIRAQKAGCLDTCAFGPSVVVYPEGIFYGKVTPEDVEEIVQEHLINDRPVERLKLEF